MPASRILVAALSALFLFSTPALAQQEKEAIHRNKAQLYNTNSPSIGSNNADVVVVEFFDYRCGYCKKVVPDILRLLDGDRKIRVVFKEYPILGNNSVLAARYAIAINRIDRDKYLDFHKALLELKRDFNENDILAEVNKLGIYGRRAKDEAYKPEVTRELEENSKLAAEIGINGTPAFVIGDTLIPGAVPYEGLQKAVDNARAANR